MGEVSPIPHQNKREYKTHHTYQPTKNKKEVNRGYADFSDDVLTMTISAKFLQT
jgi:hypothetical protein